MRIADAWNSHSIKRRLRLSVQKFCVAKLERPPGLGSQTL